MAIVKKNEYMPGQNLTNLALNSDLLRFGVELSNITVNYAISPAIVTIKKGSLIEVNGNTYTIEGSDYSFQMSNAAHNYITFTDNPSPQFGSSSSAGSYDDTKHSYYQADGITRTLDWFIDQTISEEFIYRKRQNQVIDGDYMIDRITVGLTATYTLPAENILYILPLNNESIDRLSSWDSASYKFTVKYDGEYGISFRALTQFANGYFYIYKNGASIVTIPVTTGDFIPTSYFGFFNLNASDEISIYTINNAVSNIRKVIVGSTFLDIFRLL